MRLPLLLLATAILCLGVSGCDSPSGERATADAHGHSHSHDEHCEHCAGEKCCDGETCCGNEKCCGEKCCGGKECCGGETCDGQQGEEMGPNKGHIIRLEPSKYIAEWRHYKGNSVIRVYILDANKKTTSVNATVTITPDVGKTKEPFELVPEGANADNLASVYMLDEQQLALAMNLGVTLTIEIDGKTYIGKVPPHKPHHH